MENTTKKESKAQPFSDRIRFNWGFHDATRDKTNGVDRRTIASGKTFCLPPDDVAYRAGYEAGQAESLLTGRPESSEPAWIGYCAELTAARAMSFSRTLR